MIRVVAPHFVAAIVVDGNKVLASAPIIAYSKKLGVAKFLAYCKRKNWSVEFIQN